MKRVLGVACVTAAILVASPGFADVAETQDNASLSEARTRYKRGLELYEDGDYKLALIEFRRSYSLAPTFKLLYYIGAVEYQLNNYSAALRAYQQYLQDGGSEIPESRRVVVRKDIDALHARTAHITVRVNVAGADVAINDQSIGASPLSEKMLVDAGTLRIVVTKTDYQTSTKTMTLAGADDVEVPIELLKIPHVAPAHVASTNVPAIASWSAAGLFTVGAVVSGLVALSASDKAESLIRPDLTAPSAPTAADARSQLEHQRDVARSWAIATDVFVGAAIVGAAFGTYFSFFRTTKERKSVGLAVNGLGGSVDVRF